MKYITAALFLFIIASLTACSGSQGPEPLETVAPPVTLIPTGTATVSLPPTQTATATQTVTPTLTPYLSPTATPKNFVLAQKGYDIADVRLFFPSADKMVIDFKYHLDESRKSKETAIYMTVPSKCMDDDNKNSPPYFLTKSLEGEGRIEFKMTLQGECGADGIELNVNHAPGENLYPPFYREYVSQPYQLARDFPTVNSDTFKVENIQFTPTDLWGGNITFDYVISDEIPMPPEQFQFMIYGFTPGQNCSFGATGPAVTQNQGHYEIYMNLYRDMSGLYDNCLKGTDHLTYTTSYLAVSDTVAGRTVYNQALNTPFTVLKKP